MLFMDNADIVRGSLTPVTQEENLSVVTYFCMADSNKVLFTK